MEQNYSHSRLVHEIDLNNQTGIEIGPLVRPIVTREQSNVKYVDRASTEELRKWYAVDPHINVDDIMDIDYVWGEKTLSESTGGIEQFDYCIASHVIEHIPDLITWLQEISSILKVGGVASFAVPNKRYTFDYLRQTTKPAEIIDGYLKKIRKPSFAHIYDHFSNHAELNIQEAWQQGFDGRDLKPGRDAMHAYSACLDALDGDKYIDSHCSVFTEESFFELFSVISELGLLDFKIKRYFPTAKYMLEFFVQFEKLDSTLSVEEKKIAYQESYDEIKHILIEEKEARETLTPEPTDDLNETQLSNTQTNPLTLIELAKRARNFAIRVFNAIKRRL